MITMHGAIDGTTQGQSRLLRLSCVRASSPCQWFPVRPTERLSVTEDNPSVNDIYVIVQ